MSANAFGLIIWTNFVKELKGQDQKAEKKKLFWLFPFIYRRYWLPIWATPPEDG